MKSEERATGVPHPGSVVEIDLVCDAAERAQCWVQIIITGGACCRWTPGSGSWNWAVSQRTHELRKQTRRTEQEKGTVEAQKQEMEELLMQAQKRAG